MAGDDQHLGRATGPGGSRRDGRRLAAFEAAIHRPMVVLSLAIVPVYMGQGLAEGGPVKLTGPLRVARLGIHALMAVELSIRTWLAPRRLRFLAEHRLDLVAVLVPPVRALREIVALRAVLARPGLARFGVMATAVVVASAVVVYAAEHDRAGADIQTLGDAFWWAAVTASTVGYGDEVPVTQEGRAVALILMLLGIASFSVLTAHVGAYVAGGSPPRKPMVVGLDERAAGSEGRSERGLEERLARIEAAVASIEHHLVIGSPAADATPPADGPSSGERDQP